jgi:CRISPR-associated endonuclease Csn1
LIPRDEKGDLQDVVVSFYEAVMLVNTGQKVVHKELKINEGWKFLFTLKQSEYFVFPNADMSFDPNSIDLMNPKNRNLISPHLFRVQSISKLIYGNSAVREYVFRHHLETSVDEKKELKEIAFKNIKSLGYFEGVIKVRINSIGQIIGIGEY